jgi:hypothetical protein
MISHQQDENGTGVFELFQISVVFSLAAPMYHFLVGHNPLPLWLLNVSNWNITGFA